jgi:hypothetical protein
MRSTRRPLLLLAATGAALVAGARAASAEPGADPATPPAPAPDAGRHRGASWAEIMAGPFTSSRLFAMPVADVIGAYRLSLSGDGSLLQETGILSAAGVLAIGFGDLAQLEYRHTAAISVERTTAPVPAVGVQLELPLRDRPWVPAWAIAFRLGVPRRETFGALEVDETVTDLYLVGRLRGAGALRGVTLHAGARVSSAVIELTGDRAARVDRRLVLPALGLEVRMSDDAILAAEAALAPRFDLDPDAAAPPTITTGVLGRLGVRWWPHPALSIDGSLGYQLEVPGARPADGASAIVQWDIRLGGEVIVPWGALACRGLRLFCD